MNDSWFAYSDDSARATSSVMTIRADRSLVSICSVTVRTIAVHTTGVHERMAVASGLTSIKGRMAASGAWGFDRVTVAPADERAALERAAWLIEREFDAEVEVIPESEADDEKARQAVPFRPAIKLA